MQQKAALPAVSVKFDLPIICEVHVMLMMQHDMHNCPVNELPVIQYDTLLTCLGPFVSQCDDKAKNQN